MIPTGHRIRIVFFVLSVICFFPSSVFSTPLFNVGCDSFKQTWTSSWNIDFSYYETSADASAYCVGTGLPMGSCSGEAGGSPCDGNPDYYACWANDYSNNDQHFAVVCLAADPCEDVDLHPFDDCGSPEAVIWDDKDTCSYHCEADPCGEGAVAECGDIESVVWDNVDTCEYHCDQGECEDEYQAAKLECDNPRLISSASCEYSCDCSDAVPAAQAACSYGYFMNEDCTYECKCCGDIFDDCSQACGGSDNTGSMLCDDSRDAEGKCITITFASKCECTVPPIQDPEPDPDPDPGPAPDPDDDPDKDKTCEELNDECASTCQFWCKPDPDTGFALSSDCDCDDDPSDPSDPDTPGSADDGANGWLKQVEANTNRTADGVEKSNGWLKSIKGDTAKIVNNTDNIAENTRISVKNQKAINATLQKGNALTEDGNDYLKIISEKDFSPSVSVNVSQEITTEGTSEVALGENTYSATFTEEEGFAPLPEDGADGSFSKGLSDYIATGIPLISYIEGMSINLSSSSPVLNMMFWGRPVNVDFSAYVSVIDVVGNILFALSIISGFMLIIARITS
jgi:hypothetical protein